MTNIELGNKICTCISSGTGRMPVVVVKLWSIFEERGGVSWMEWRPTSGPGAAQGLPVGYSAGPANDDDYLQIRYFPGDGRRVNFRSSTVPRLDGLPAFWMWRMAMWENWKEMGWS